MTWKLELWDDPEYAAGASRLAFVDVWGSANIKLSVDGTDTLSIVAPYDAEWLKTVQPRHVLKVTDELDRVSEWRVIRIFDGRGNDEASTQIECEGLLADLSRPLIVQQSSGGAPNFSFNVYDVTAEQLFDQFITPRLTAEGLTHYVKGTLSSSETMTFAFERYSVLELINEINNRTTTERWIERDDVAGEYKINLGTRGASEPTVRTAFSRGNLQTYIRDRDSLTVSTVTIPTGKKVDGAANKSTLGFNAWKIASATGLTLELADPAGDDGPIAFDDQLNSLYALRPVDAGAIDITDSSATGQTITVAAWPRGAEFVATSTPTPGVGTITFTEPVGTASGDLITALVRASASGSIPTITKPSGWTEGATYGTGSAGAYGRVSVYYITRGGSAPTGTFTATGASMSGQANTLTNIAATGAVVDVAATGVLGGAGVRVDTPTLSTSGAGTYQIGLWTADGLSIGTLFKKLAGPSVSFSASGAVPASRAWGIATNIAIKGDSYGWATGDHVQIVADQSATLAYELTNPSGVSSYGRIVGTVDDEELRDERNWFRYGTFTGWSTGDVAPGVSMASAPSLPMRRVTNTALKQIYSTTVSSVTATGGYYQIDVSGLPLGSSPSYGDLIQTSSGGQTYVRETLSIPVSTGGSHTLVVQDSLSTGDTLIGGPSTNGSVFQFSHDVPENLNLYSTDTIRVKYVPGYETLWASVGFTAWADVTASASAATGLFDVYTTLDGNGLTTTATDYPAFTWQPTTWTVGGQIGSFDAVLRHQITLTQDRDIEFGLRNATATGLTYFTNVRWMQLHLGTDSQVPPIYGSHGNRIWQRGNQHLRVFGTPPTTYQVSLIDLVRGAKEGLAIADDGIALGGKIRLIDADIGQVDLRIVELRLNGDNPYDSTVTLATIPPRLAKIARRARFAPPTRPDPTPPTEKPADEQPGAPLPVILAPEVGVTAPATIKLVGDVWSLYA